MISQQDKENFWGAVKDCLTQFHHLSELEAQTRLQDVRYRIEHPPVNINEDVVYHAEPFDLACGITGETLPLKLVFSQYEQILSRNGW